MARTLRTVSQFASASAFSEAQLRWFIFNAATNGLQAAGGIVRIGRRVYISEEGFDRWIAAQQRQEGGAA